MPVRGRFALTVLAAVVISFSCGGPDSARVEETVFDLIADLPFSRRVVETTGLDLGAPGSVAALGFGWSHIERSGADESFRWALGEGSQLHFDLVSRRDLELELVARPFGFQDGRVQTVDVSVNGTSVGTLEMRPGWHDYRVSVPLTAQRLGTNSLDFGYHHAWDPALSPRGPRRRLAVAWRSVGFVESMPAVGEPMAIRDESTLFLPSGNRVEFFLEIPRTSSLRIDEVVPSGENAGKLLITVATDGSDETVLFSELQKFSDVDLELLGGRTGIVRLAVAVEGRATPAKDDGYLLARPRVVSALDATRPPAAEPEVAAVSPTDRRPNVLVYLVDTLRTDAVGSSGPEGASSPAFDRFAADATLFENAVGQSSWTRSSVASLFTGLLPQRHGAVDRLDILASDARTLAEVLGDAGYTSAAFITNPNVTGKFGFAQGFDDFFHIRTFRASDEVNEQVFGWLDDRADAGPFFLYVHTMDPHHPYLPPEPMRPAFAPTESDMRALTRLLAMTPPPPDLIEHVDRLRALYDAAARFNDQSFGELIDFLDDRHLLDDTVVLFLSDHGEEFFEHGDWQHGKNLHVETLNVPLAIRFPDVGRGQRIRALTGHVDLLPTLLDYLDLPPPDGVDGRSVLPLLDGSTPDSSDLGRSFAHLSLDGHESVAVADGEWKLITVTTRRGGRDHKLYNWTTDPAEQDNLALERPILVGYLESMINRELAAGAPSLRREEAELDTELERSLKALGYLQ